ncbi:protein-export chaperone SecB [Endozoicomonas sp. G2_2]|uniref:protein-export chaperone SecB n=1 Tax=Gammaproteobacteria TaxID=1236 RepID=UPI000C4FA4F9|nr:MULTISPECIES: protein-export chaperone SecB [Gammaproteobacteria]MAS11462.1 protein-export chaperone SecB [Salinisphaera sp.]MBO9471352.1 protein-export chaperone SecB [Endozoicomonas sp. G2_2]|tara:strand:- start:233 stop:730 length:498 start_codon:yes stop_codon:yes gene_type:complete
MAEENGQGEAGNGEPQRQVGLQKIYIRDASIEVPNGPRVFTEEYKPDVNVDLNTRIENLSRETHQVTLTVTVTAKQGERTAYIVEVQQAGVFQIEGFDDDKARGHLLGAYCPSILFPYIRESVGDMVQRAGFPHFLLQPVNFDLLYAQHQQNQGGQPTDVGSATH